MVTRAIPLGVQVRRALLQAILSGDVSPEHALTEEGLARQFGVSRGPIREALKMLESQHVVQKSGRSYTAVGILPEDVDEIYDLRLSIEALAWRYAVTQSPPALASALEPPLVRMREAAARGDSASFATADVDFHAAAVQATRRRRVIAAWKQLEPSIRLLLEATNDKDDDLERALAKHAQLRDAAAANDERTVGLLLRDHLANSRRILSDPSGRFGGDSRSGLGSRP